MYESLPETVLALLLDEVRTILHHDKALPFALIADIAGVVPLPFRFGDSLALTLLADFLPIKF